MTTTDKMLEKIDIALKNKKESELYIIYIGIFLIVATISYLYIYPVTDRVLKMTKTQVSQVKSKIAKERNYLNSKTVNGDREFYIKKAKMDIKKLKEKLSNVIYANGYIDDKLKELSYILYNDVNWANFIDSIAKNAKKYGVNINYIKNSFHEPDYKKVQQVLDVEVDADGSFNNVIKFLNSIEESKLVVDVHNLKMTIDKNIHINFHIAVWGMRY